MGGTEVGWEFRVHGMQKEREGMEFFLCATPQTHENETGCHSSYQDQAWEKNPFLPFAFSLPLLFPFFVSPDLWLGSWVPSSPVNMAFTIAWWFPCGSSVTPEVWYLWGPDSLDTGVLMNVESSVLYEDSSVTWGKEQILLKFRGRVLENEERDMEKWFLLFNWK